MIYFVFIFRLKKSTIFPWKVLQTGSKSDSESQPSISSSKDDENSTPKKLLRKSRSKRKHEEHSDYSCSICNFHSEKWFTFEDHAKIVHGIAALFSCQIMNCFKYYQSKNGLKNHCKTCHLEDLSCTQCSYVANGPLALRSHIQEHSEQSHKKIQMHEL